MGKCDAIQLGGQIPPSEVDWVNEHVAKVTSLSLEFLYQTDPGREPDRRHLKMELDAFTALQQANDSPPACILQVCNSCKQDVKKQVPREKPTITRKMAMSKAWSQALREKVKESERERTLQICVDPYFEDWE